MNNKTIKERIIVVETEIKLLKEENTCEHTEIKKAIISIDQKLDTALKDKVDKDQFCFWRNILVAGIFVSIFLMVLGMYIK